MGRGNENCNCTEDLCRFLGQTVTIYTASGGCSGTGFTGVLISVDCECIRLLTSFGAPPACPIGSACGCCRDCGFDNDCWQSRSGWGWNNGFTGNPFGSVCVIPTRQVVCYTIVSI